MKPLRYSSAILPVALAPVLAVLFTMGGPSVPAATQDSLTISEIVVKGNKTLNTQAIITVSGHNVGDPCTTMTLGDIRDRLAKSGNFGIHYPDRPEKWVSVMAEDRPNNKCKITITVDENDPITAIEISGTGPVKSEEVKALITKGAVFNASTFAQDRQSITNLYNRRGYSISFGEPIGMDPVNPGTLLVPIIVDRVGNIEVKKDGVLTTDAKLLGRLATKAGGYFNRKVFYEQDRRKLLGKAYDDANFTEHQVSLGVVDLKISLVTKQGRSCERIGACGTD